MFSRIYVRAAYNPVGVYYLITRSVKSDGLGSWQIFLFAGRGDSGFAKYREP